MDKKKWEKVIDLGDFNIETDGVKIRAIDKEGHVIIKTDKK